MRDYGRPIYGENIINLRYRLTRWVTRFRLKLLKIKFERKVLPITWKDHNLNYNWATSKEAIKLDYEIDESPVNEAGRVARDRVLVEFRGKYKHLDGIRVLIQIPPKELSPGGYSLFTNLLESIQYLGVACEQLEWGAPIHLKLSSFRPNILLSSDQHEYLRRIDWSAIQKYRILNLLNIGLTASIYNNTPIEQRLRWAKRHQINFYYSFTAQECLDSRLGYRPFYDEGYPIYSVELGANPLHYFPVDGVKKDLDYVFLASSNSEKQQRCSEWLLPVFSKYPGFIDGPGWSKNSKYTSKERHRYIYARAKIGVNLHIDDSINYMGELNERTYMLAACGVPQLIDNPKLLNKRFTKDAVFSANSPKEYKELFEYMLTNPAESEVAAVKSLNQVYSKHTTFHRAEGFIRNLQQISQMVDSNYVRDH